MPGTTSRSATDAPPRRSRAMSQITVACIQLNAGADLEANLETAARAVRDVAGRGAELIALPEYCVLLDGSGRIMRDRSPAEEHHPALPALRAIARETGTWLLIGSLTVKLADERMANRS